VSSAARPPVASPPAGPQTLTVPLATTARNLNPGDNVLFTGSTGGAAPQAIQLLAQVTGYTPRQHHRHDVRPGITGWAQVQGRAGIPWEERIELDLWYAGHRSATLDARILLKTLWLLVTGHGLAPD